MALSRITNYIEADGADLNLQSSDTTITASSVLGVINFKAPSEASGTDAILLASKIEAVAEGTFSASSNATKLSFATASSEAAAEKMALSSGGDLSIVTDGASIFFGADSEIELRHVADEGLTIKAVDTGGNSGLGPVLNLSTGDTDIAAGNQLGTINFQAPDEGTGTDAILVGASITAIAQDAFSSSVNSTSLLMRTSTSGTNDGGYLELTPTGNVNIRNQNSADDSFPTLTLQTGDTDIAQNDVLGKISFQAPSEGAGTDAVLAGASIQAISEGDFSSSSNATTLEFMTGASEAATTKMKVKSDGDVEISDGDLVIGTAGHGIDFSNATDEGTGETTTSSILDDYEEGSFSVTEENSSIGMTVNFCNYTKIGRAVHFIVHVTFGSGTDSSPVQLSGMPFDGNSGRIQAVSVFTQYTGGQLIPIVQGTTIFMSKNNATVDLTYTDVASKYVRMSGTYQIL